ncbi:MAG: CPXCG motif-containing cysteine-rich protein [Cellvibrionaceae bacterium]|nr:CPXCG motif-containing cysteine-rich protein [Cellvibrionaceae bacterium]
MLAQENIYCPYCGEIITVLVDEQEAGDQYIEDCQVCCRPIVFRVAASETGELIVNVFTEDEAY